MDYVPEESAVNTETIEVRAPLSRSQPVGSSLRCVCGTVFHCNGWLKEVTSQLSRVCFTGYGSQWVPEPGCEPPPF